MLDSFRIRAVTIKRNIKISAYLPKDYYKTDKKYPLLILFDGQYFFKFLDEDKRIIDFNSILESENRDFIVIAPHAPKEEMPDWRISELNPYYKGNIETVDSSLASNYAEYITNELVPMLKTKYRFSDEIYLLGYKDSAILSLYMLYAYSIYKGAMIFSPNLLECNHKVFEDIDQRFDTTKKIFIYQGGKDALDEEENLFYDLQSTISKGNAEYFILDYEQNLDNSAESMKSRLNVAFDMIIKKIFENKN